MIQEEQRSETQSLRKLLRDWRYWKRGWKPDLGYPHAVPYIHHMRPIFDSYTDGEDYDRIIDAAEMKAVDAAIENDLSPPQRAAILLIYLNEIGPAVWRSNRIAKEQARALQDEAEAVLVKALKRRNVRLG